MRLAIIILGATLLAAPQFARAADTPEWETCISVTKSGAERLPACSAVIEGKKQEGRKLAAAYCIRGNDLTEKGEFDAALKDLNAAIEIEPTYACAFNNRARVYGFKGDYDRAIADYDEAIRLAPGMALAYNNRGDAFFHKGQLERAIVDFDAAIAINPAYAGAYGNRAFALYRLRDYAGAIENYSIEIRIQPNLLAYINRGDAYRDSEQLDRAAADYGEAIRLAPSDARGWRNRGLVRLFQGKYKAGIADYDKALRYDPADAASWNNRAQAKMRSGDKKGAIADFRKTIELQPGLENAVAALKQLGATP